MLEQKYFGLSLTTWIVIAILLVFLYCSRKQENFVQVEDEEDNTNDKLKIYNFNTSWCGYSKQFQPVWDEFQQKNKSNENVIIKDVKCDNDDDDEAIELCQKYDVPGYPTVIFHKGDNKVDYQGKRTVSALEEQMELLA
tara:strand:+ start:178 stop:594 length:417 start_codon:yes stop_codon:yes gene_type:complete